MHAQHTFAVDTVEEICYRCKMKFEPTWIREFSLDIINDDVIAYFKCYVLIIFRHKGRTIVMR